MKRKIIVWMTVIIIVSNFPFIDKDIMRNIDSGHFRYSNADASFTYVQQFGFKSPLYMKRNELETIIIRDINPTKDNIEVFRLYRINPLCFWRWSYYLRSSRHFRYKNWEDIESSRVPYDPNFKWQKF